MDECFPHEFPHMFKREFSITVQLWHVYATAQVNTQNYLAVSQIIELFTGIQILTLIWVKVCN